MQYLYMLLAGGVLIFSGCAPSQSGLKDTNMSRSVTQPAYQILKSGNYPHESSFYAQKEPQYLVFRSDDMHQREEFAALYTALTGEEAPVFDGTVIVGLAGVRSSGGYALELKEINQTQRGIEVRFQLRNPPQDAMVTTALTHPFLVLLLPDYFAEVSITETK